MEKTHIAEIIPIARVLFIYIVHNSKDVLYAYTGRVSHSISYKSTRLLCMGITCVLYRLFWFKRSNNLSDIATVAIKKSATDNDTMNAFGIVRSRLRENIVIITSRFRMTPPQMSIE